jgi:hypothetical protein
VATNVEATHSVTFTVSAATSSHGSVTFTASGSFTIPAGVISLTIDALGGGGGGGEITGTIPVTPGSTVTIAIGTGSTVSFTW